MSGRGVRGGKTVRIPIIADLDSSDERERYLARVLRNGLHVDDKRVLHLKGAQLLEYLALLSLSSIDPNYLKTEDDHHTVNAVQEQPRQASEEKPSTKKRQLIKADAEKLKGILL